MRARRAVGRCVSLAAVAVMTLGLVMPASGQTGAISLVVEQSYTYRSITSVAGNVLHPGIDKRYLIVFLQITSRVARPLSVNYDTFRVITSKTSSGSVEDPVEPPLSGFRLNGRSYCGPAELPPGGMRFCNVAFVVPAGIGGTFTLLYQWRETRQSWSVRLTQAWE